MQKNYTYFSPNELKVEGWVKTQLELQRDGLNGNLDKVWPDVRDSKWIGGDREGWERVPYWLDGFIPLAYLLDDEDMKKRAKRYIDKIIESQQEDGWICPNGDVPREKYDTWAVILIAKVLTVYYDCSRDKRIPSVVYRIFKNYYELLESKSISMFSWAKYRWFEAFVTLKWLKANVGEEKWMYDMACLLEEQGTDYEELSKLWEIPLNRWRLDTHVVNIAMMLKSEALVCGFANTEYTDLGERLYSKLKKYNGTPVDTFTGDECLSGLSPIQGTELCSVVELMYSYETLYALTGDVKWAERLERCAYNALPATISDDMWTHQYDQMSNQISCQDFGGNPVFRTNGRDANVFGLEPHFGCCTANFGQGWPKLALSAFMRNDREIVSSVFIPSTLSVDWKGAALKINLNTEYPFKNRLIYTVEADKSTDAVFKIRIPTFAENLRVNGKPERKRKYLEIGGFESGKTVINIEFDVMPKLEARPYGLYSVRCGSLVFAAKIDAAYSRVEYVKNGVERKYPYCDYKIIPCGEWNFAFASKELNVKFGELGEIPFSSENPPITVEAELCHIDWGYEEGFDSVCAKKPRSRKAVDRAFKVELYPYGCAKLRMTEMPMVINPRK